MTMTRDDFLDACALFLEPPVTTNGARQAKPASCYRAGQFVTHVDIEVVVAESDDEIRVQLLAKLPEEKAKLRSIEQAVGSGRLATPHHSIKPRSWPAPQAPDRLFLSFRWKRSRSFDDELSTVALFVGWLTGVKDLLGSQGRP